MYEMRAVCAICTELYDSTQPVSAVQCGHTFHDGCLEEWLHQSLTCPQCRVRVDRRKIIHKLFFTIADDGEGEASSDYANKLHNELETVKLTVLGHKKEKADLLSQQTLLKDKIQELQENYKSLEKSYKQECTKNKDLRKQLVFHQKLQKEGDLARDEAVRLRNKLEALQNVEKIVQGSDMEISEMVHENADPKQLATWCSVLRKELGVKRAESRTLRSDLTQLKRDLDSKKHSLQKQSSELVATKEQAQVWEEGLAASEKEIAGLKKRLEALQKAVDSPSSSKAGLVHRLLHESPAPMNLKKKNDGKRAHSSDSSYSEIDLNVSGDLFVTSPEVKRKRKPSDDQQVKMLNIDLDSSRPSTCARQASDSSPDLPHIITGFNLFKKRSTYGLQEQPSVVKQGYNGLGGHEKFLQPRGKPFSSKPLFKKPKTLAKSNKKPPLPNLDNYLSSM